MKLGAWLSVVLLVQGWWIIHGSIEISMSDPKTFSSVECLSQEDIKITFCDILNVTRIIAYCDVELKHCNLNEQTLGNYYAVYYTGNGAMVRIANGTKETTGSYACCETYNSQHCVHLLTMQLNGNTSHITVNLIDGQINNLDERNGASYTNVMSNTESLLHGDHKILLALVAVDSAVFYTLILGAIIAGIIVWTRSKKMPPQELDDLMENGKNMRKKGKKWYRFVPSACRQQRKKKFNSMADKNKRNMKQPP